MSLTVVDEACVALYPGIKHNEEDGHRVKWPYSLRRGDPPHVVFRLYKILNRSLTVCSFHRFQIVQIGFCMRPVPYHPVIHLAIKPFSTKKKCIQVPEAQYRNQQNPDKTAIATQQFIVLKDNYSGQYPYQPLLYFKGI